MEWKLCLISYLHATQRTSTFPKSCVHFLLRFLHFLGHFIIFCPSSCISVPEWLYIFYESGENNNTTTNNNILFWIIFMWHFLSDSSNKPVLTSFSDNKESKWDSESNFDSWINQSDLWINCSSQIMNLRMTGNNFLWWQINILPSKNL